MAFMWDMPYYDVIVIQKVENISTLYWMTFNVNGLIPPLGDKQV